MVHGKVAAVVGGGDNGLFTARRLTETARHVHLFVRSELRGFEMNEQSVMAQIESGRITLHRPSAIQRYKLRGEQIEVIFNGGNGQAQTLLVDYIAFRMGFAPNVETIVRLIDEGGIGPLKLDRGGYVETNRFLRTSIPHIYAAGDVANPRDPCVATAVAQGAIAARSVEADLRQPPAP